MAILEVLHFPDERLRRQAKPVEVFDAELREFVADMIDTMRAEDGVGLAAVQVNVLKQVIVIDVSGTKSKPWVLINPKIIEKDGEQCGNEGCLSVPGFFDKVSRAASLTVWAYDEYGRSFELPAEGLLAVCIQHEMDHLQGILFIDHLSKLKRERIRKKLEKLQQIRM